MATIISNDLDFQQNITQNPLVIVKYHADWCGNCRLISPKYKNLSEDPQNSSVIFLEVNAEENPIARKAAGVTNLPFFATFSKGQLLKGIDTSRIETVQELITEVIKSV
jgi:thiol-disulfide isomerase/thioredoxin